MGKCSPNLSPSGCNCYKMAVEKLRVLVRTNDRKWRINQGLRIVSFIWAQDGTVLAVREVFLEGNTRRAVSRSPLSHLDPIQQSPPRAPAAQ